MRKSKKLLAEKIVKMINEFQIKHKNHILYDIDFLNECQKLGFNLTASNFYSNTPIVSETNEITETLFSSPKYNDDKLFNENLIKEYFKQIKIFASEFKNIDKIANQSFEEFKKNSQFNHSDALAYHCIIRKEKPKNIVEFGCGFSSKVSYHSSNLNQGKCNIYCFEPYPSEDLLNLNGVVIDKRKAQEVSSEELNSYLCDGDILFIDSTHVVKEGSDVLHLFLSLLPKLKSRVFVHVHDIFLPFNFPSSYLEKQCFWEEQYLLYALILDNPKVNVIYGSTYNSIYLENEMKGFSISNAIGGGSFWFEYDPKISC